MPLTDSGAISLDDMHQEAGGSANSNCSINDSDIRDLIGKADEAQSAFNEFYGASAVSNWIFTSTVDSVTSKRPSKASTSPTWMAASRTGDGVYLVTSKYRYDGNVSSDGGDDGEINITKINADGSVAWVKRIDGVDEQIYTPTIICTTTSSADDVFLWFRTVDAGGLSGSTNKRRVLKINGSGVEQAERKYATPSSHSEYAAYKPATNKVHDDGTYIWIAGESYGGRLFISGVGPASAGLQGGFWTKIQKSDGAYQDEFISADPSGSSYGRGPVFVDGSGNVSMTGTDPDSGTGRHIFSKYNSSKAKVFEKYYGYDMGSGGSHKPDTLTYYGGCITGGQHVMACSMVTASESGIATDYHMSLQKLDPSDGSVTWWIRAVASESDGFQLMDVQVDSSGNLYAVGWGKVGSDSKQSLWCGKFNSSGTKQWNFALGLADDSIAFIPGPLDIDNSDNVYFTGYYNTYVDGSNYTKAVVMKVAGGALPTAGTTGIWKITDTDFAFASVPGGFYAYNASDTQYIGTPSQISDASASDVSLDNETGQSVTLVSV